MKRKLFIGLGIVAIAISGALVVKANVKPTFASTAYYLNTAGTACVRIVSDDANAFVTTAGTNASIKKLNGNDIQLFSDDGCTSAIRFTNN